MKNHKLSFLFFVLAYVLCVSIGANAQQELTKKDSVTFYYDIIRSAKKSDDLIKAHRYYNNQKELSLKRKDTFSAIQKLRFIASIERKLGQLEESEATSVLALEYIKKIKNKEDQNKTRIGVLTHLGLVSSELEQYNRALEFYNSALEIATTEKQINSLHNNIGFVYKNQKKYKLADSVFNKVYQRKILFNDSLSIARSLNNLGYSQFKIGKEEGLSNMKEALAIRLKLNHKPGVFTSYLSLHEYYKDIGNTEIALDYVKKAYKVADFMKNDEAKVQSLSLILDIESTPLISEYKKLSDSIERAHKLSANKFISYKYDYAEEKQKTNAVKLELAKVEILKEKANNRRLLFQLVAFFVIIVSTLLYYLLQSKHKKDSLLQVFQTEARIAKRVHDEVANEVYLVMNKMQNKSMSLDSIIDDVERIYFRTRDISKENSSLELNGDFSQLLVDLLSNYKNETTSIITKGLAKINWNLTSDAKKTIIFRILQELLTNMKKHSKASLVVVSFGSMQKKITITYKDNGIGTKLNKGLGLTNVENRIDSVNGMIKFDSEFNKGFKVSFTV